MGGRQRRDQRQPRPQPRHGRSSACSLRRGRAEPAKREVPDRLRRGERHWQPVRAAARGAAIAGPRPARNHRRADDCRYKQLVARAHAKGIKVIGSPIGPYKGASYWSEEGEAARQRINEWILNGGAFDGIVRFDTAFADPADPLTMR